MLNDNQLPGIGTLSAVSNIGIIAANYQHTFYTFNVGGEEVVRISREMGEGKISVSDEHIKYLLEKSPQATNALFTIMNSVKDEMLTSTLREAINNLFVGLLNEFHKDIVQKVKEVEQPRRGAIPPNI